MEGMENRLVKALILIGLLISFGFLGGCAVLDDILGGYYLLPEADLRITSIDPNYLSIFWEFQDGKFVIGDTPMTVRVSVKQLNPVSARLTDYTVTYFDNKDNPLWDLFLSGSLGVSFDPMVVDSPSDYPEHEFPLQIITKSLVEKALEKGYTYLAAKVVLKGKDDAHNPISLDFSLPIQFSLPPEDTTRPVVAIDIPNNSTYTTDDSLDINVSAWDDYYVKRIELYIDGGLIAVSQPGETSLSYYWDLVNTQEGTHTIKALAYDFADNVGVAQVSIVVKNPENEEEEEQEEE